MKQLIEHWNPKITELLLKDGNWYVIKKGSLRPSAYQSYKFNMSNIGGEYYAYVVPEENILAFKIETT